MSAYLRKFREPSTDKPQISSISKEHWFLILLLCLVSVEIGTSLASKSSGAWINLVIGGMLVMNWVAFQFQWSRMVTALLRSLSVCWILASFILVFVFWR
jgi:hypothetical protein